MDLISGLVPVRKHARDTALTVASGSSSIQAPGFSTFGTPVNVIDQLLHGETLLERIDVVVPLAPMD